MCCNIQCVSPVRGTAVKCQSRGESVIKSSLALCLFGVMTLSSHGAIAQTRWSGDGDCVAPQRIEAALERLRPDAATLSVSVYVERMPAHVVARVSRGSLERTLEASNCEQLADSLVLVLSLFPPAEERETDARNAASEPGVEQIVPVSPNEVGPNEVVSEVSSDVSDDTPDDEHEADSDDGQERSELQSAEEPGPSETPASQARLATWIGAGVDLDVGSLSAPSFAPSLTLTVEGRRLWIALTGAYRPSLLRSYDVGEVSMSGAYAGLLIGSYVWKSRQEQAGLILSGGTSAGLITAESRNVSQPGQGRVPYWALHADAHLHWSPWLWLRIRFHGGLGVPLIRAEFRIQGLGTVYSTPNLLGRVGVSVEVRFWSRNSS